MIVKPSVVGAVVALALAFYAVAAQANDSTAILKSGELQLTSNPDIRLVSEELYLSAGEVRVAYRFHNTSQKNIDTLVAFPLPDITVGDDAQYAVEQGDADNFIGFKVVANGQTVEPRLQLRATRFGVDRTNVLKAHGLSVLPFGDLYARLEKVDAAARAELERAGLVDWHSNFGAGNAPLPNAHWQANAAFHWQQRFPAGQTITVSHSYRPVAGMTFFDEHILETPELRKAYCMDEGFLRAARKRLAKQTDSPVSMVRELHYVLTTANNWRGAIGDFKLTIDKGAPGNLVSLCRDGIKKTGPTTFEFRAKDFTPETDLKVLIVEDAPRP